VTAPTSAIAAINAVVLMGIIVPVFGNYNLFELCKICGEKHCAVFSYDNKIYYNSEESSDFCL